MSINVVHVGTQAHVVFTGSGKLQWTFDQAPSATNAIIIPWCQQNASGLTTYAGTATDNQSNTYQTIALSSNSNGSGGTGATGVGMFYCPNVSYSGGNFILTINVPSSTGGQFAFVGNHIEVTGLNNTSPLDQTGTATSGSSFTNTQSITASGANALANELVVANYCGLIVQFFSPGVPTTGYSEISNYVQNNGSASQNICTESAYKVVSSLETSSALWTVAGGHSAQSTVMIATFKVASAGPTMIAADWYSC